MQCDFSLIIKSFPRSLCSSSRPGVMVCLLSNWRPWRLIRCDGWGFISILNALSWLSTSTIIILYQDLYFFWILFLEVCITLKGHSWCVPFDTAWQMHTCSMFFLHIPHDLAATLTVCTQWDMVPAQESPFSLFFPEKNEIFFVCNSLKWSPGIPTPPLLPYN